jgi:hypothetical protein
MSTHEHDDPFAPADPAAFAPAADAPAHMPFDPTVPHFLMGAVPPLDPADPFGDVSADPTMYLFGVQTFDHASALNDNPFTATDAGDDGLATPTPANPSGNPLASVVSSTSSGTGDPYA